ncbi:hypothetical protein [Variovorax sp. J31P207]|uniref:hypothetical protein n=1 Tax=Variovorax sp. J31P207 TaxID=3053510 RepID=UPI002575E208|nr:hypothetical protein [Variovorax sp. J31P207]MDM0066624.1 hypothetical protein [Variovorax sp. J31P207]
MEIRDQEEISDVADRTCAPDLPDSLDWKCYLQELERAVPGVYSFQFIDRVRELWFLSAGIKAHVQELLLAAYERARRRKWKVVSWEMVVDAYHSAKLSATREEVEQLIAYSATGKEPSRDFGDLACPFESAREVAYRKSLAEAYLKPLGEALTHASLSPREARALADVKKDARGKQRVAGSKGDARSAAGLLANAVSVLAPKRARPL